jgi:geranylgeranyl pyrophosphate synthase
VAGLLARTIGDLCRGQVAELQTLYDVNRTEEQYYPSIAGKTASLFSAATRIGGIVAGRDRATIDRLTEFGKLYGMAFQIVDDILDVIATDEQLGKPAGKDMLEGVYSLPVIYSLSSPVGVKLREILLDGLAEADRLTAIELVRQGPAVERALGVAAGFVERARAEIMAVSDNRASRALADTAQHLLESIPATSAA